jgi:hypothetical protein
MGIITKKVKTHRHKTFFYPKQYPAIEINIVNPMNHKYIKHQPTKGETPTKYKTTNKYQPEYTPADTSNPKLEIW